MTVTISANDFDGNLQRICGELAAGNPVGLPTETVYGLAADATNGIGVARIFEMKGRPQFNPLICHVSGLEMAEEYGDLDPISKTLADAFWPGPLTIVVPLKANSEIHPLVSAELGTVGLRCPSGIANKLIQEFGRPLAAPSANKSGRLSPTKAEHVAHEFSETDLVIIDAGQCGLGLESTIVKAEGDSVSLLRPGSVTSTMIEEVTGIEPELPTSEKIQAPGMMKSHYAPNATVRLNCTGNRTDGALLKFGSAFPADKSEAVLNLSESGDLVEAAANLYAFLKQLDASGTGTIFVEPIPHEGLGIAINDRLKRAAAPRIA